MSDSTRSAQESSNRIRVLLVDDHPLVRGGIRALLQTENDIEVVGEAGGLSDALSSIRATKPDVVILDIRLKEESGLDLLPDIKALSPDASVIVLSSYLNPTLVSVCTSYGVSGYLIKDTEQLDVASAVRLVAHGGTVFDPRVLGVERPGATQVDSLSPREFQVLDQVCRGLTNAEIARELGVSENTVKGYVSGVMRKLDCDNRVKLVLKAKELNLV